MATAKTFEDTEAYNILCMNIYYQELVLIRLGHF